MDWKFSVRSQLDGCLKWEKSGGRKNVRVIGLDKDYVTVAWGHDDTCSEKTIEIFQLSNGQRKLTTKFPTT
jgi:hypothetical protein